MEWGIWPEFTSRFEFVSSTYQITSQLGIEWLLKLYYKYCFTSLSAQSWQYRDRRKPEAGTMPYSYFEWLQGFFIVCSTIGSTIHSGHLNSLEHCICTIPMTNVRPTEIWTWYLQVTSPSRYEWAIGAGDCLNINIGHVWHQIKQIWVIFTHLKLWVAVARHKFKWVTIYIL